MELDPVFLSRLQFAFVVSFHIVFPAFTIGLAAWLAAAPEASLGFLFYGAVIVLPVIAAYTVHVYWVFRGKVHAGYG